MTTDNASASKNDYDGPFDPALSLDDFSRDFLSRLCHEYNLLGHLLDRVGMPVIGMKFGLDDFVGAAIEEWQGASPIYSKRMQALMNFEGDTVETVFKNLQLEVGAPQQFMDFQFRLDHKDYGEFWLAHCGALLDLEKNGNDATVIKKMCWDIEDPTFDATAAATHPKIVMRPFHRPPRIDAEDGNGHGRYPHCRWKVYKEAKGQDFEQIPLMYEIAESQLAKISLVPPSAEAREQGGLDHYAGEFDPHLQFEDFSQSALQLITQEQAVQTHLLAASYVRSNAARYDEDIAREVSERQWVGHAALCVERLQANLGLEGDDIETMAKVFQLHPHFYPRSYIDFHVDVIDASSLKLTIGNCPALTDSIGGGWFDQLGTEPHPALEAIAAQVNPKARCFSVASDATGALCWEIVVDPNNEPLKAPLELQFGRTSLGVKFQFERRRLPGIIARG